MAAQADTILWSAERAQWITRGRYQPTAEQHFFGAGGLRCLRKEHPRSVASLGSPARLYHWITNWEVWGPLARELRQIVGLFR